MNSCLKRMHTVYYCTCVFQLNREPQVSFELLAENGEEEAEESGNERDEDDSGSGRSSKMGGSQGPSNKSQQSKASNTQGSKSSSGTQQETPMEEDREANAKDSSDEESAGRAGSGSGERSRKRKLPDGDEGGANAADRKRQRRADRLKLERHQRLQQLTTWATYIENYVRSAQSDAEPRAPCGPVDEVYTLISHRINQGKCPVFLLRCAYTQRDRCGYFFEFY